MKQQPAPEERDSNFSQSPTTDADTKDRIAHYLSDGFEHEAYKRLIRAREAALQADDLPVADDAKSQ